MHKSIPILIFLFTFSNVSAQIHFEKGYFITMEGAKTECLIRNVDWQNNPSEFDYKLSENSEVQNNSVMNIEEFGIDGVSRYVRRKVKINSSSDDPEELDLGRTIEFEDKTLFLKELVAGDATLYSYENGNLKRFFYSIGTIEAEQLIYKRFFYSAEAIQAEKQINKLSRTSAGTIGENTMYKQQLLNNLKCDAVSANVIKRVRYKIHDLIDLFENYNKCANRNYVKKEDNRSKFDLKFSIRPGVNFMNLSIANTRLLSRDVDFGSNTNFRIGGELEAILPFNKNKWSVFLEPTFQSYKAEGETISSFLFTESARPVTVEYSSLDFPIGLRHYLFLNDKIKMFVNAAYTHVVPLNSELLYENISTNELEFDPSGNFSFGVGLKLINKLAVEARYRTTRELFGNSTSVFYTSEYSGYSLIVGYTIF